MKSELSLYSSYIESTFGKIDHTHRLDCPEDKPISLFYINDVPQKGYLTAISYGLSESQLPGWNSIKPEIIVSLKTHDESWGIAAAFLIRELRQKKNFCYGEVYSLEERISNESNMVAYFVMTPEFLPIERRVICLPDKRIELMALYPIYKEEIDLYRKVGMEKFWMMEGSDFDNIYRKNLGLYS